MDESNAPLVSALLSRIRKLRLREYRESTVFHYIEGFRNFIQALDARIPVETILYSEVLAQNSAVQKNVRLQKRAEVPVVRVKPEQFRLVSGTPRASGIGAIVRQYWTHLSRADPREGTCWIAFSSLRSRGNIGTILRTAEATGVGGAILIGDHVDPFDPDIVRASMGGVFRLRLVRCSLGDLVPWKARWECRFWGTSPLAAGVYTEACVESPW